MRTFLKGQTVEIINGKWAWWVGEVVDQIEAVTIVRLTANGRTIEYAAETNNLRAVSGFVAL